MKKVRKHYTAEEKVAILRRHLLEQEPVSKLCDELGLQPTVFYRWQKEFFENGAAAFEVKGRSDQPAEKDRIQFLEKTAQRRGPGGVDGGVCRIKKRIRQKNLWVSWGSGSLPSE